MSDKVLMGIQGIGVMCGNDVHGGVTPPMVEKHAGVEVDSHEMFGGDVYLAIYECVFCGSECCVVLKVIE